MKVSYRNLQERAHGTCLSFFLWFSETKNHGLALAGSQSSRGHGNYPAILVLLKKHNKLHSIYDRVLWNNDSALNKSLCASGAQKRVPFLLLQ